MKELVLELENGADYALSLNAILTENPTIEIRDGREYIKHAYLCPLNPRQRAIKFIQALVITIFTAFFALFSNDVRTLWFEAFKGKKPLIILSYNPSFINNCPDDVLNVIFNKTDLKTIGRLASVSTRFDQVQNTPSVWAEVAKTQNFPLDPANLDIKGQLRDAVAALDLGYVDVINKIITWSTEGDVTQQKEFFQKAISLFEKKHYVKHRSGNTDTYYYHDIDGHVKSASRHNKREYGYTLTDITIRQGMTEIKLEQIWEERLGN